jgi:nitroreductase
VVTTASASVSEAIETRRAVRDFKSDPVAEDCIREILSTASRAASGGNLQPWKVYVLAGVARDALVRAVADSRADKPFGDGPEYQIYPDDLTESYRDRRSRVSAQRFELLGIARGDSAAHAAQMAKNFEFFGAPVGMIITIERQMGSPQFCDLGIFIGNIMLLARERGLHTCPQEAWSMWGQTIRERVGVPDDELVFCGIALGYAVPDSAVNQLRSERASVDEFAEFL